MTARLEINSLVPGEAHGRILRLDAGLSFWGGLDPATGVIIDRQHPQQGACISGQILVLPAPRGSTAAPGALLECLAAGHGPAAIVLAREDIIPVAAVIAAAIIDLPRIPVARLRNGADLERIPSGASAHLGAGALLLYPVSSDQLHPAG